MKHLRSSLRTAAADIFYLSGIHRRCHQGRVLILAYHRVLPRAEFDKQFVQPPLYVLDTVFEMHMQFLKEHYHVISFRELLDRWKKSVWEPNHRYCVITFDDGWIDNYLYAYPILMKYGFPATVFLPTDFVGTYEWFWPEKLSYIVERVVSPTLALSERTSAWHEIQSFVTNEHRCSGSTIPSFCHADNVTTDELIESCKGLSLGRVDHLIDNLMKVFKLSLPKERMVVTWEEVSKMSKDGISFGSHSCSHRILTKLPQHEILREMDVSRRILQEKPINYVPIFCYPNGFNNEGIRRLVRECSYEAAVSLRPGSEDQHPQNWQEIRRIGMHHEVTSTIPLLAFHLFRTSLANHPIN